MLKTSGEFEVDWLTDDKFMHQCDTRKVTTRIFIEKDIFDQFKRWNLNVGTTRQLIFLSVYYGVRASSWKLNKRAVEIW